MKTRFLALLFVTFISCKPAVIKDATTDYSGWTNYAGTKNGARYSSANQLTVNNVSKLKVAWVYSSHDKDTSNQTQNQCNPIVIGNILYGSTPTLKLFSLDAATGKQKWLFDPAKLDNAKKLDNKAYYKVNRGVVY